MKKYLKTDEWNIIEKIVFKPTACGGRKAYSVLGTAVSDNGVHFEETIQQSTAIAVAFVAGITFLDKTRVGLVEERFSAILHTHPQ